MIKTGICSYGMSGKLFHAPFIANHPGFELTAIVERSKDESRAKYPGSKVDRSIEELVGDESIDLMIVNTPVQTHFEFAQKAIKAGKHVIVEKPFTVTVKEAEELVQLAKANNVLLFVYQNRRYDGDYHAVKEVLNKRLLGDIKEAELRYDRFRTAISPKKHKESGLPGSGIIYDLGAHLIDQALQLFGEPNALFADMMAMRDASQVDDYFEIILYYDRSRVRLKGSSFVKLPVPEYILNGAKGTFLQNRSDMQETKLLEDAVPTPENWCPPPAAPDGVLNIVEEGKEIKKEMTSSPGNYMNYFDDVYKAIVHDAPNPVPGQDGIKIIRIIESAKESAMEGKIIRLR